MSTSQEARWSHVGLNCKDQQETEYFYTRWFGFRRARVVEDGGTRVVFLRRGDAYLELFQVAADPVYPVNNDGPQYNGTVRHIAFQVDDVDDFLRDAAGALPISLGPLDFDKYIPGWKTAWVTDPDGVVVEVSQGYTDQPALELDQYR
jgi:glyoxylase I family protein